MIFYYTLNSRLTIEAETHDEAETLLSKWLDGLSTDLVDVLDASGELIVPPEEESDPPYPPDYDFQGYDNYPGYPL